MLNQYLIPDGSVINDRAKFIERRIGDNLVTDLLENYVIDKNNVVIMGPKGSGKSSLLHCFFNGSQREKLASEQHILSVLCNYPIGLTSEENIFGLFADQVRNSVEVLKTAAEDDYKKIKKEIDGEVDAGQESRLKRLCGIVQRYRYYIFLVMDSFENFVNSTHVNPHHHDILNNLLDTSALRFVVATDYDFEKTHLPPGISGSYLLQKFTCSITVPPLDGAGCKALLKQITGQEDFSDDEIEFLRKKSRGTPTVLKYLAGHVLQEKKAGTPDWQNKAVDDLVREEGRQLFAPWLKYLTEQEAKLIHTLNAQITTKMPEPISVEQESTAAVLEKRGLIFRSVTNRSVFVIHSMPLYKWCVDNPLKIKSHTWKENF